MPEIPDLTIYARNLQGLITGREINGVRVGKPNKLNVPIVAFESALVGKAIGNVAREGKELLFTLNGSGAFAVHLMLSGRTLLISAGELATTRSLIAGLSFADGGAMAFCDNRSMLRVTLNPKPSKVPDALSEAFSKEYFARMIHKNASQNIKTVLINQKLVRGIGNAYVDEILYDAGISPESVTGKIPGDALDDLYVSIGKVLRWAISEITRIAPDIIAGEERGFLKVHMPKKKMTDNGEAIIVKDIELKRTYFTARQAVYR